MIGYINQLLSWYKEQHDRAGPIGAPAPARPSCCPIGLMLFWLDHAAAHAGTSHGPRGHRDSDSRGGGGSATRPAGLPMRLAPLSAPPTPAPRNQSGMGRSAARFRIRRLSLDLTRARPPSMRVVVILIWSDRRRVCRLCISNSMAVPRGLSSLSTMRSWQVD